MTTACLPNRKMASLSTGKVRYRPSLPSAEYGRRSFIGHSQLQSKVEEMFIMMHLNSLNYTTFVWVCIETNVIDWVFFHLSPLLYPHVLHTTTACHWIVSNLSLSLFCPALFLLSFCFVFSFFFSLSPYPRTGHSSRWLPLPDPV